MIILLTAIAVLIIGVPLAAVALVTLASRHEEHARSIAGHAPGVLAGAARRLLGFRATGITRPACRAVAGSRRSRAWLAGEYTNGLLAGEYTDGLLAGEYTDGLLAGEYTDGLLAGEYTDGLLAGEPADGLLAGEPADGLLAGEPADGLDPIGGPALAGGPVPLR